MVNIPGVGACTFTHSFHSHGCRMVTSREEYKLSYSSSSSRGPPDQYESSSLPSITLFRYVVVYPFCCRPSKQRDAIVTPCRAAAHWGLAPRTAHRSHGVTDIVFAGPNSAGAGTATTGAPAAREARAALTCRRDTGPNISACGRAASFRRVFRRGHAPACR